MRLFVALDIPEDVRVAIGALITKLRLASQTIPSSSKRNLRFNARWVRIEGAHVTLKFIGEVPTDKMEEIRATLATMPFPTPVKMIFRGLGFFPNEQHPRVLWARIEASAELAAIAATVETTLEPLGFTRERRTFSPHLTLARFNSSIGLNCLRTAIAEAGPLEFGSSVSEEFHLYQSVLKRGGAEYTRLATYRFIEDKSR